MVERDIRDHRDDRPNDIRRVEPAAHSDFQDDRVDVFPGEVEQAHRRRDLEERRPPVPVHVMGAIEAGDGGSNQVGQGDELLGRGGRAIDAETKITNSQHFPVVCELLPETAST